MVTKNIPYVALVALVLGIRRKGQVVEPISVDSLLPKLQPTQDSPAIINAHQSYYQVTHHQAFITVYALFNILAKIIQDLPEVVVYVECDIVFDLEGGQRLYGVGLFPAEVELRGLVLFDYVLPIQS